jgi:MoaA/NifB/PqqE/SkfB family radical SAM enzyme
VYFKVDQNFLEYFRNLKQVFLYITDECNLRCIHCLYKPDLTFHLKEKEIDITTALALISDFREMGASKLTIMGGEPTLYGASQEWEPLLKVIKEAKDLGYEYVRIDTNGQFKERLLEKADFKKLDEVTFSLDGPIPEINDAIRGKGSFEKCVKNIKKAIALGYRVDITCCVHKGLIQKAPTGDLWIDEMIKFAEDLGVNRINFHDLLRNGTPRDTWTADIGTSVEEWVNLYSRILNNIKHGKYKIPVRFPQCFVRKEEFERHPQYYGYCPVKLGERVLVHPNGIIRICALMIGTPYGIAWFYKDRIIWNDTPTNEARDHKLNEYTPCTNQSKGRDFGEFVPLCISFKPEQDEFIWQQKLQWEKRKRYNVS